MGVDVYCVTGFRANMQEIDEATSILHVAVRGLQTPNGRFPPWKDWGQDLRQFVLGKHPVALVEAIAKKQIRTDERVRTCKVVAVRDGKSIIMDVTINPEDETVNSFSFKLTVTEAAVVLVPLQRQAG